MIMKTLMLLIGICLFVSNNNNSNSIRDNHADLKKEEKTFKINEIDLHVHAGKERPLPMQEWLDLFAKDGRKVLLLLDHLELYRMNAEEHRAWITKNNFTDWYPNLNNGKIDFQNDLEKAQKREDLLIFRGWEIWEGELDEGLDKEPMKDTEVIGWHMSKAAWDGRAPKGKELIHRAKQILEVQKEFPVPMIIFHPFNANIKAVRDAAAKAGKDLKSIKKEEYRYFTSQEQKELIGLLKGSPVFIEIERDWANLIKDPVVREAFREDILPLAEAGVRFTVSTDAHRRNSFDQPYDPESYCRDLGVTAENVNSIIRELLEIRAKKNMH